MKLEQMTPRGRRLYDTCLKLGYKDIREQPHAEVFEWAAGHFSYVTTPHSEQKKAVDMEPRGCFKTSGITIGGTLDLLKENPNLRFLWATHTHKYTMQILSEAKWLLERDKLGMGDVKTGSNKWAEEAITLSTRTSFTKEPTIDTCGLDNPKVGGHYDVIIVDDLHTRENITPNLLRKARFFMKDLRPVLEPGGLLLVVGTRWHMYDIYDWIYKQNDKYKKKSMTSKMWDIRRKGCYDGPNGLYFPSRLTFDFLEDQRMSMDDKEFSAQYLNVALSEATQLFPSSLIHSFEGSFVLPGYGAPYIEMEVG